MYMRVCLRGYVRAGALCYACRAVVLSVARLAYACRANNTFVVAYLKGSFVDIVFLCGTQVSTQHARPPKPSDLALTFPYPS